MAYILSEIPTGLINGVNTVFNTSQSGTSIIGVFKDGAEIIAPNYTYVGTTLTFTTPPIYGVSIVYIVGTGFALNDGEILLPNHQLVGTVDGTNKVFTVTGGGIKQVLSVVYDGAETRDFSFTPGGNTITFVNAPTYPLSPIYVDYITFGSSGSDNNFSGNASQASIINRIYNDILHEKTTSSVFNLDTTKSMINEIQNAICTGGYTDLNGITYKSPNLNFLNKRSFYKVYGTKNVSLSANPGSSTLKISNDFPTTGTLLINGNIVQYNGNDGETISGIIGLNTYVDSGDSVNLIYSLNSDVYKNFSVKSRQGGKEYILNEIDSRDNVQKYGYSNSGYFITEDYYGNKYIGFSGISDGKIEMNYVRTSPDITGSVNSILPNPFALTIIPNLVCARRLIPSDEGGKAKNLEIQGVSELKRLYENFASKTKEFKGTIESDNSFFQSNF